MAGAALSVISAISAGPLWGVGVFHSQNRYSTNASMAS